MTVYPDLAFLLGLIFHGAVFRLSLSLMDLRRPPWQFLLCSFCCGLSSSLILLPQIPAVFPVVSGLFVSVLFLRGKTLRGTVFNVLTGFGILMLYIGMFLIVSGGLFRLVLCFTETGGFFLLPLLPSLISVCLPYLIFRCFARIRKKRKRAPDCCDCVAEMEGKRFSFRAYVDTGNFLKEPVSGRPVVILEFAVLQKAFGGYLPPPLSYEFFSRFSTRARVIPYRSVSGEGRMLSAFVPESFSVNGVSRDAVIAVSDRRLECRGRFSGIIGPDLTGGE